MKKTLLLILCTILLTQLVLAGKPITITNVDYGKTWNFDLIQDDMDLIMSTEIINYSTIEFLLEQKQALPGGFKWSLAVCNETEMNISLLNEDAQGGFNNSYPISVNYGKLSDYGLPTDWCNNTNNYGHVLFSSGGLNQLPQKFRLNVETNNSFEMWGGTGSFVIVVASTQEGMGGDDQSWDHRIFYDKNNNRWHLVYIDSNSDITAKSAPQDNTSNWSTAVVIGTGAYDYDEFDCAIDYNESATFLHCIYGPAATDQLFYKRTNLTGATPFLIPESEQTMFEASDMGGSNSDDATNPHVTTDSTGCLLVVFDFEDAGEPTVDEHQLTFTKQDNSVCGTGIFGIGNHETGFPQYGLQHRTGSEDIIRNGIESFGDLDAQIFWADSETSASVNLSTIYFNGTNNNVSSEISLYHDIEGSTIINSWSVIVENTTITFAANDTETDLEAHITTARGGPKTNQTDTTLSIRGTLGDRSGRVAAIVDNSSPNADDIWVFAPDTTNLLDIYYAISTDGGFTWDDRTLWQANAAISELKFVSAAYDGGNCDIMVTWLSGSVSPFNVSIATINTENCVVGEVIAPIVNINVSLNNTEFSTATPTIHYNYTDADSATANCILYFNNTNKASNSTTINNTQTSLVASSTSDGDYSAWVNCTDLSSNEGTSDVLNISVLVADSCTYVSSDWNVDGADNCVVTNHNDLGGNSFYCTGAGTFTLTGNITNFTKARSDAGCKVSAQSGGKIG